MKCFLLLLSVVFSIFIFASCESNSSCFNKSNFSHCVSCYVEDHWAGFDYRKASENVDAYLLRVGLLSSDGRADYEELFKNLDSLAVDGDSVLYYFGWETYSLYSPTLWSRYIECAQKNTRRKWNRLSEIFSSKDSLKSFLVDNEYVAEVLGHLSDKQFEDVHIKIIFQSTLANLLPHRKRSNLDSLKRPIPPLKSKSGDK